MQPGAKPMRVGIVGINHKLAELKLREKLAKICQKYFGAVQAIHERHSFVLLSTCNRTEIYFSSDDLAATHTYLLSLLRSEMEEEFEHKLYSYFGSDCFSHLVRVILGLDSAIPGETEIKRQVKVAYELVASYHALPKVLHFLFQKSLGIAKRIRSELQLGQGMPNLEHAVFHTGKHFFKELERTRILFVGASEINQKILCYFKTRNFPSITLCNRSNENARHIAQNYQIDFLEWEYLANWHHYDWIIFGTKSPDHLISRATLSSLSLSPKLIMDLSVPRNVEPELECHPHITLLNIDHINRLLNIRMRCMSQSLSQAEAKVIEATYQQVARYKYQIQSNITPLVVTA